MFCSRCGTEVQKSGKFCPSCGLDLTSATTGGSTPMTQSGPAEQTEFDIVRSALKGEYELIKELGRGGMAIVYRAKEKGLDREVAVKVLPFSLAFDKDFVERFEREARTAAKLEHPHIIPIYRVGRNDKVIYFVMKLLRGKSLSDVIKERGALPPDEARRLLAESAHALHYAHKNGIVHRDVKPDNIMLDEMDRAIVTDFGIAKAASQTKLTGTGMSIGTPHYMSPEQARAQPLDGRSDIYSLGVVAYQCLTGSVPFDGDDSFSIGYKHIMEEVPTPKLETREQRELFDIIRKMMAKNADERFQDAEALARVLEGKSPIPAAPISSAPTLAMRVPTTMSTAHARASSATTPTTPMPKTDFRPSVRAERAAKRGGGVLVGMFLMLLMGGGAGGWYYYSTVMAPAEKARSDSARMALVMLDSIRFADSLRRADSVARADSSGKAPAGTPSETRLTGTLLVSGLPNGGRLMVDGNAVDATAPVEVDPGAHRITAKAIGYEDFSGVVTVARGVEKPLTISMSRIPGFKPPTSGPAATRVAAQCDAPGDGYNLNNLCWDDRAVANAAPLVPIGDDIPGNPSPVILHVLVSPEGVVQRVMSKTVSNNPDFQLQAINFVKTITFKPAQKEGQPVKAWVEVMLRPTRNQ